MTLIFEPLNYLKSEGFKSKNIRANIFYPIPPEQSIMTDSSLPSSIFPSLLLLSIQALHFLNSIHLSPWSLPNSIFPWQVVLRLAAPSKAVAHLLPHKQPQKSLLNPINSMLLYQTLILNFPLHPNITHINYLNSDTYPVLLLRVRFDLRPALLDLPPPTGKHPT